MYKRIKDFIFGVLYSLPFGMKAADKEIMGTGSNTTDGTSIEASKEVSDERVGKHLLKGEVTQSVEELRYRTYAVEEESGEYKYVGDGKAVKKEKKKRERYVFKFSQENKLELRGIANALNDSIDMYAFEFEYSEFNRFRLEKFAQSVDVYINERKRIVETTLHFSAIPNPYDAASMAFINEFKKLMNCKTEREIRRIDFATTVKSFGFRTNNAVGEDNHVNYAFMGGGTYAGSWQVGNEFKLKFTWNEFVRLPIDFKAKYYSNTMADKYREKTRKDVAVQLGNYEEKRVRYCSICGKEINLVDGDILEASGELIICNECMMKATGGTSPEVK